MKRTLALAAGAVVCVLAGAVALSAAEHIPFPLALYWAAETGTTVGYGDVVPRTGAGHIIAVLVMLTAIPLLGATFASLTAMHIHRRLDRHQEDIRAHVDRALAASPSGAPNAPAHGSRQPSQREEP